MSIGLLSYRSMRALERLLIHSVLGGCDVVKTQIPDVWIYVEKRTNEVDQVKAALDALTGFKRSLVQRYPVCLILAETGKQAHIFENYYLSTKSQVRELGADSIVRNLLYKAMLKRLYCFGLQINFCSRGRINQAFERRFL